MKFNSCSYLIHLFFFLQLQKEQNKILSQVIKTIDIKANCTHLIVLRDDVSDATPAAAANTVLAPKAVKSPASVIQISLFNAMSNSV